MTRKHLGLFIVGLTVASCAPSEPKSNLVRGIANEWGCEDAEARFFDRLIDEDLADPTKNPAAVRHEIIAEMKRSLTDPETTERFDRLLEFLLEEAARQAPRKSLADLRQLFAAFELGITPDQDEQALVDQYQGLRKAWTDVRAQAAGCAAPTRVSAQAKRTLPPAFANVLRSTQRQGMQWAFAVAYQSCEVLNQPAMRADDPFVQGITINGTHPDGIGRKRFITDLVAVQRTHPYLKQPPLATCQDVRLNPLIYDYGGRPYILSTEVDLHRNSGSGTSVLGIDCSAYVGTALATAGLKTKSSVPLRPAQAGLYSSRSFLNPEGQGLNCLKRISVSRSSTLKDGDIVAISGHVFMVDRTGADPFGLNRVTQVSDCDKIDVDGFSFEIYQSSPENGGVGLNRYVAKDYLAGPGRIKTGLLKYAVQACKNRFSGATTTPKYSDISIIRHSGTASCIDTRIPIAREACVSSCFRGG